MTSQYFLTKKDWSVPEVLKLIALYRESPVLWDKDSRISCKVTKDESLQKIARIFNTNSQSVNRKVHNLRTQYFDEVRKVERTKELRPYERFIPKWIYFNHLTFLTKAIKSKKDHQSSSSLHFMKMEGNGEIVDNNSQSARLQESYMLQMFHESEEEADLGGNTSDLSPDNQNPSNFLESPHNNDSPGKKRKASWQADDADDYSIFGAFVASEMRGLRHDSTKKKLKCSIMHAILNAIEEDREGGGAGASTSRNSASN